MVKEGSADLGLHPGSCNVFLFHTILFIMTVTFFTVSSSKKNLVMTGWLFNCIYFLYSLLNAKFLIPSVLSMLFSYVCYKGTVSYEINE